MKEIKAKGRGKTFANSVDCAKNKVNDDEPYLIRRHGLWFRPNAHGYTAEYLYAGVFDGKTAKSYLDVDGLSVVPLNSLRRHINSRISELEEKITALRSMAQLITKNGKDKV